MLYYYITTGRRFAVKAKLLTAGIIGLCVSAPLRAQEQPRQLGAHVHGAGRLNVAIEGNTVSFEFNAPAHDIVGFEHEPSTPEQKATLAAATQTLKNVTEIFAIPQAAGCKVKTANVTFDTGGDAEHADDHAAAAVKDGAKAEGKHADFDADYELACADATKLTGLSFPYFQKFPGSEKLTVTVITAKGQTQFAVTRANPKIEFAGQM
jgi:hypothetical protein